MPSKKGSIKKWLTIKVFPKKCQHVASKKPKVGGCPESISVGRMRGCKLFS